MVFYQEKKKKKSHCPLHIVVVYSIGRFFYNTVDLWRNAGFRDANSPCSQKSTHNLQSSLYSLSSYPQFCIPGFNPINQGSSGTIYYWKKSTKSGPMQFTPMLFKSTVQYCKKIYISKTQKKDVNFTLRASFEYWTKRLSSPFPIFLSLTLGHTTASLPLPEDYDTKKEY